MGALAYREEWVGVGSLERRREGQEEVLDRELQLECKIKKTKKKREKKNKKYYNFNWLPRINTPYILSLTHTNLLIGRK